MGLPRPNSPNRSKSHLPPHERQSIIQIPVTPGVGRETYDQDYFERIALHSPSVTPSAGSTPAISPSTTREGSSYGSIHKRSTRVDQQPALRGNIISVTFTVPHVFEYREGSDWELRRCYRRSALLDAIHYLSAEGSYNHTVVAWTGEICYAANSDDDTSPDGKAPVVPSPTSISLGGKAGVQAAQSKNVFVTHADQLRLERQLCEDGIRILPVWLADEKEMKTEGIKLHDQSRWRREPYSEGTRWADYCRMNQLFAERVFETYQPGDTVVVHDYYFMLLPRLLRKRHPNISVAFCLHTPFPSSELIRCLGRRQSVLEGILSSDLIVFQSFHYAQHFANSCARILGLEASSKAVRTATGRVGIEVIPMGINISTIHSSAWKAAVTEKCSLLRKQHSDKKIIVAYDHKDRLGGVDKKLLALDRFLAIYPEYQNRVILLQVMSQTTNETDDREQSKYTTRVSELVSEINRKYGSLDHMPIQLHSQSLSTNEYFALLRSGDLALFTNVRDGMSTTSLEYVVCQQDAHGPAMISEFSGTANSLKEAIHINPWDTSGVADQIHKALNMSEEERQNRHAALFKRISEGDVGHWVTTLIHRLKKAGNSRDPKYFAVNGLPIISEK